jgi:hypothetical protein
MGARCPVVVVSAETAAPEFHPYDVTLSGAHTM